MNEIKIEYYAETSFKTKAYFKNIKILKSLNLKKNDVFIDVGSHRGEELNYLKDLCFVHGFECNPLHFKNLLSIYGGYRNITLNKNLVTDVHGEKRKCFFKNTNRGGSMSEEYSKKNILEKHISLCKKNKGSIIFGLDSFAEGVDLKGELLSHVIIAKLR